jgi:YegS/Rv2252/BmrU family lipid kinase
MPVDPTTPERTAPATTTPTPAAAPRPATTASARTPVPARRPAERRVFLAALTLYSGWTIAVATGATDGVDRLFGSPVLDPRSLPGQLAEAFALLTHPVLILLGTLTVAVRAYGQRQRRLSLALVVAALGVPAWELQRLVLPRERPVSLFTDSVSAAGDAYPSGHMVAATLLTWVAVTLANAQRKSARSQWKRRLLGGFLVGCVGADQWAMSTQWGSDLIGGVLLGVTVASAALWITGVDPITRALQLRRLAPELGTRAAVIYNPTKILDLDLFRRRVHFALVGSGWLPPIWMETMSDDAGPGMARDALAKGVDLVLVAGGDGTVRAVCAELAHTGVPVGLVPAGTGNLLCRNLGIPFDEDEALEVALRGVPTTLDMVRWTVDDREQPFAVMAGVGIDAEIMRTTSSRLKKVVKSGAYVVAAAQQLRMAPFRARVTIDGRVHHDGDAVMTLVGNVGRIQGGIDLLPSASPTDGELDVLVASGHGIRGMARLALGVRRGIDAPTLAYRRGRRVEVELDRPLAYQLDGDIAGTTTSFTAEVVPGALVVMAPAGATR